MHPSDFESKRCPLNACLLSGLRQTSKVQTKAEIIERNVRWQESSSKRLVLELPGCTVRLNGGVKACGGFCIHVFIFLIH